MTTIERLKKMRAIVNAAVGSNGPTCKGTPSDLAFIKAVSPDVAGALIDVAMADVAIREYKSDIERIYSAEQWFALNHKANEALANLARVLEGGEDE